MAASEKPDKFSSIINRCFINPSQSHQLLRRPFARQSEFPDESPLFSSLQPSQPSPTQIFMLSLPETQRPADEPDDAVFPTPEQQNAAVDLKKARVRVWDHQIRASQDGDKIGGNKERSEVVVLDSDSEDEMRVDLSKIKGKGLVQKCDQSRGVEQLEPGRNREGLGCSKIVSRKDGRNGNENRDGGRNGDKGKGAGFDSRKGGASDKAFDEIDKFLYNAGGGDERRRMKPGVGAGKRHLPASIQGNDNGVVKKKSKLDDVLKLLDGVGSRDERSGGGGGSGDVDYLAAAKKQGIVFPRPRWWPPEYEGGNL